MNNEFLINLVEQRPQLYNRTLKDYKDDKLRENIWISIAEHLNSTPDAVKKRWDNLRDRFVRAYREFSKKPPSGSASGVVKKTEFVYFDIMLWLAPFIRKRKMTSSVTAEAAPSEMQDFEIESQAVDEVEEVNEVMPDDILSPMRGKQPDQPGRCQGTSEASSLNWQSPRAPPPSRTRNPLQESMAQAINSFNKLCESTISSRQQSTTIVNNRSDTHFMTSVVEDMQSLPPKKKLKFKKEVMEVLIRYVEDEEEED